MIDTTYRRFFLLIFFLTCILLITIRLIDVSFLQSETLQKLAEKKHLGIVSDAGVRGKILDRHGRVLARSLVRYQLIADPLLILNSSSRVQRLAKFLRQDSKQLHTRLKNAYSPRYFILKKELNYKEYQADKKRLKGLKLPGLYWEKEEGRFYPYADATAHLLGFTNYQNKGHEGLELYLNSYLSGRSGSHQVLLNSRRKVIKSLDSKNLSQKGQNVALYLDIDAQLIFYDELKSAFEKYHAMSASGILIDVDQNAIIALVNQPGFNPNDRSTLKPHYYRNRVIWDLFEPGSTIKPFILATALQSGVINEMEKIDTSSPWVFLGHRIYDVKNYTALTPKQIIKKSSNVGAAKVSRRLEPEALWRVLSNIGFAKNCLASDFYQYYGQINHYKNWYGTDQAILGYGYGLSVSLLQLACSYLVLINDGVYRSVKIIQDIDYNTQNGKKNHQVLEPWVTKKIRKWMVSAVQERGGTANRANLSNYQIAGKTGTVKQFNFHDKKYSEKDHIALFAGMVMNKGNRYLMLVMVNQPKSQYYGGQVAAPIFQKVMSKFLRIKR